MLLKNIEHVDTSDPSQRVSRRIVLILGMPFYQSSGTSSCHAGTWFPFFGLQEKTTMIGAKGSYIKPFLPLMDFAILNSLLKHFPSNPYNNAVLHQRFGSRAGIVLSSWLGGGLWNTDAGQLLKAELISLYPDFYRYWPKPEIKSDESLMSDCLEEVNAWLCQQANVKHNLELEPKVPTIEQLIDCYKPKPQPEPKPKPQIIFSNYLSNTSNLGSIKNEQGKRRSARLKYQ